MRHICNLIVPGFPKCGTSSLHQYLDLHPLISMSIVKEPHYFAREDAWSKGVEYHNGLFNTGDAEYFGESSTISCIAEIAVNRAQEVLEKPRIIFLLRDPVERVLSHYKWLCVLGLERRPLSEAIKIDGFEFDANKDVHGNYMAYIEFSRYAKHVKRWLDVFGKESVLLLFSDELRECPQVALNKCWDFLNVERIKVSEIVQSNVTAGLSSVARHSWEGKLKSIVPEIALKFVKSNNSLRSAAKRLVTKKSIDPVIADADVQYITELLQEEIIFYRRQHVQACRR